MDGWESASIARSTGKELAAVCEDAYRTVAPAKLVAALEASKHNAV